MVRVPGLGEVVAMEARLTVDPRLAGDPPALLFDVGGAGHDRGQFSLCLTDSGLVEGEALPCPAPKAASCPVSTAVAASVAAFVATNLRRLLAVGARHLSSSTW